MSMDHSVGAFTDPPFSLFRGQYVIVLCSLCVLFKSCLPKCIKK
jgi:hypothetical protein